MIAKKHYSISGLNRSKNLTKGFCLNANLNNLVVGAAARVDKISIFDEDEAHNMYFVKEVVRRFKSAKATWLSGENDKNGNLIK